jgi:hypothetical protein
VLDGADTGTSCYCMQHRTTAHAPTGTALLGKQGKYGCHPAGSLLLVCDRTYLVDSAGIFLILKCDRIHYETDWRGSVHRSYRKFVAKRDYICHKDILGKWAFCAHLTQLDHDARKGPEVNIL